MENGEEIQQEAILSRIRNLINENKIKLWLAPFYNQDTCTPNQDKMLQTANALAPELELDDLQVFNGMLKLQNNALEKLKSRQILNQSGQIELKLKLDKKSRGNFPPLQTIKIDVYESGADLAAKIAQDLKIPLESFKLVTAGSVLKNDLNLHQQNLKPGQTIMLLSVDMESKAMQIVSEQRRILNTAKEDAEILGNNDEMTITDQSGKHVELPKEERKAIIIAMSLHEKGKAALRKNDFQLAIILLLEAKDEYNQCRSEILKGTLLLTEIKGINS